MQRETAVIPRFLDVERRCLQGRRRDGNGKAMPIRPCTKRGRSFGGWRWPLQPLFALERSQLLLTGEPGVLSAPMGVCLYSILVKFMLSDSVGVPPPLEWE